MTLDGTTWTRVLDEYEARLDEQRACLDRGEAGYVEPFRPPAGLGPLPAELAARADDLLRQARDLEIELADNVAALAQDLAVVRTVSSSTARPSRPVFVDFSA
jgi:hypothetical protein